MLQVFRYCEGGAKATPTFYPETLAGIRALPGIAGASAVSEFALCLPDQTSDTSVTLHDRPAPPPGDEPPTVVSTATPSYLDAMPMPLRAGRCFDERDDAEEPAVAVANETLAQQHWPDETHHAADDRAAPAGTGVPGSSTRRSSASSGRVGRAEPRTTHSRRIRGSRRASRA